MIRVRSSALLAAALLASVAFAPTIAFSQPRDTGNMAYPTPLPQGNIGSSTSTNRPADTGNMAYPASVPQGNVGSSAPSSRPADTGNMAYPAPLPQGNVGSSPSK